MAQLPPEESAASVPGRVVGGSEAGAGSHACGAWPDAGAVRERPGVGGQHTAVAVEAALAPVDSRLTASLGRSWTAPVPGTGHARMFARRCCGQSPKGWPAWPALRRVVGGSLVPAALAFRPCVHFLPKSSSVLPSMKGSLKARGTSSS